MKNLKLVFSVATLLVIFILSTSAMARETIVIAAHDYAPYYNNQGQGMMVELFRSAGNAVDMDVEVKVLPIKRAIKELLENNVDAFSPGTVFMPPDQAEQCSNYNTFNVVTIFAYHDPGKTKKIVFNAIPDLKGYKVGLVVGSPLRPLFEQSGVPYTEAQSPQQLLKMLHAGRFDFVELTLLSGMLYLNKLYGDQMDDFGYVINFPANCWLSFHNGNPRAASLKPKIIKGFEIIKKNGEYVRIAEKYWGKGNIQKEALPEDLAQFGVEKADLKVYSQNQ